MGFEVEDIDQGVVALRARGLELATFEMGDLEVIDQIVVVPGNYPSKGTGERGAHFFDSEGNLLSLGQPTCLSPASGWPPASEPCHRRFMPNAVADVAPDRAPITAPSSTARPSPTSASNSAIIVPIGP